MCVAHCLSVYLSACPSVSVCLSVSLPSIKLFTYTSHPAPICITPIIMSVLFQRHHFRMIFFSRSSSPPDIPSSQCPCPLQTTSLPHTRAIIYTPSHVQERSRILIKFNPRKFYAGCFGTRFPSWANLKNWYDLHRIVVSGLGRSYSWSG